MTIKLYDIDKPGNPIQTFHIYDSLLPYLFELYERDCVFDKFDLALNHDASYIITGSYR